MQDTALGAADTESVGAGSEDQTMRTSEFTISSEPTPVEVQYLEDRLYEFNSAATGITDGEWLAIFGEANVPVAPVQIPEELSDDPQVVAAGIMEELVHPVTGPQRVVGPVARLSATPTRVRKPSPTLGADTDAVLAEAGLTAHEIAELRAEGVIA